jgi:hypothetical protein
MWEWGVPSRAFDESAAQLMPEQPVSHEWKIWLSPAQIPDPQELMEWIWGVVCYYVCGNLLDSIRTLSQKSRVWFHYIIWHGPLGILVQVNILFTYQHDLSRRMVCHRVQVHA